MPALTQDQINTVVILHAREVRHLEARIAELIACGDKLSEWMREHTGERDGTKDILIDWHYCRLGTSKEVI